MSQIPNHVIQANINLQNVMQRLVPVLWRMHHHGFPIGSADLSNNVCAWKAESWQRRIADVKQKLFDYIGRPVNLNNHHPTSKNGIRHLLYAKKSEGGLELEPVKIHGKTVSNKYAVCKLHYLAKQNKNDEIDQAFKWLIETRLLTHRYQFATARLLLFEPCKKCEKDNQYKCLYCGGTGHGKVLGFDPRYCSERNGWIWVHPTFLQNQITLRVGCLDPNLEQVPRNNDEYKIDVRDQYCAPPDYRFVMVDGAKTERLFAAVRFNDPVMLDEVMRGHPAVAEFGELIFGTPREQITKNSPEYAVTKTLVYATQLGGTGETVHNKFMENYRFFEVEYCQEMVNKCLKRYEAYYTNGKDEAWKALKDGWWATYHGQRFLTEMPYELDGYSDWRRIKSPRASMVWEKFVRFFLATHIQGPATGMHLQNATLLAQDDIDRLTNPNYWDESRVENGNPDLATLVGIKHDEIIALSRKEIVPEIEKILVKRITNIADVSPYLAGTLRPDLKFDMKSESVTERQWGVHVADNWQSLTQAQNPLHYYNQDAHRFRV